MGAIWGNCVVTALKDAATDPRGIVSGILQQGYAFGYSLATVASRALVNTTSQGWCPLDWFVACPPLLIILFRLQLPETQVQQERQPLRDGTGNADKVFVREGVTVVKKNWIRLVLFMVGMSFTSHGSQDLYPTLLKNTNEFNSNQVTVTQVVANVGDVYPGSFGVIPIHLLELTPPKYSTLFIGATYQLGNLISSTSTTVVANLVELYPLPPTASGKERYDYGKVILMLMAIVYAYLFLTVLFGPEARGYEFDVAQDEDLGGAARET